MFKKKSNRVIATILCICMLFGVFAQIPNIFAENTEETKVSEEIKNNPNGIKGLDITARKGDSNFKISTEAPFIDVLKQTPDKYDITYKSSSPEFNINKEGEYTITYNIHEKDSENEDYEVNTKIFVKPSEEIDAVDETLISNIRSTMLKESSSKSARSVSPRLSSTVVYEGRLEPGVGMFTINGARAYCGNHILGTPSTGTPVTGSVTEDANLVKTLYYGQANGFSIVAISICFSNIYAGNPSNLGWYGYEGADQLYNIVMNSATPSGKGVIVWDTGYGGLQPLVQLVDTYETPRYDSVTAEKTHTSSDKVNVKVQKTDKNTGENLEGFTFNFYRNDELMGNATTDVNGWAELPITNTATVSKSSSKSYCSNYDKISDADKSTVVNNGYYTSRQAAQNAADSEASQKAKAAAEAEAAKERTYKVVEAQTKAPYVLNATAQTLNASGTTTLTFGLKNTPQVGVITIIKKGEVLTSVGDGTGNVFKTFNYTTSVLGNAQFEVYAEEDIYQSPTTKVYSKGDFIGTYTTKSDGTINTGNLYLGAYKVVEIKAPTGLTLAENEADRTHIVTLSYAGQNVDITTTSTEYVNNRPITEITTKKVSSADNSTIANAEFTLYSNEDIKDVNGNVIMTKGTAIEKVYTNSDGNAKFTSDIPMNFSFIVKETTAPTNYYKNDDVFSIKNNYINDTTYNYSYNQLFKDKEVRGKIELEKKDLELFEENNPNAIDKNGTQSNASLQGATYELYAAENIMNPNGKGAIIHKKDTMLQKATTDENAKITFSNLYLGKYYVKEVGASTGYLLDTTVYNVNIPYEGQNVEIVTGKVDPAHISSERITSLEQVKKQAFELVKISTDGDPDEAVNVKGAEFTVKLTSDIEKLGWDKSPTYDVLTTNEIGYAKSIELPYGTYTVKETKTPVDMKTIPDFSVTVSEDNRTPQTWRIFNDAPFDAYIKLWKQDKETGKTILLPNTSFKIKDEKTGEYIKQKVGSKWVDTFTTDDTGTVQTPLTVKVGSYKLVEIKAPNGYTLNEDEVSFKISTEQPYRIDEDGDAVVDVIFKNVSVKGQITVKKEGEVLISSKTETKNDMVSTIFYYDNIGLNDASYEIIAAEDIMSADNQKDIIYAKDQVVETIKTTRTGEATSSLLPLGKYIVREVVAPNGFALGDDTDREVTLSYKDQVTPVVYDNSSAYVNERQKISLVVNKSDTETTIPLANAIFELYAKENIVNHNGDVLIKKDAAIETAVTDENGKLKFASDLPLSNYYLKEIKAPDGYVTIKEPINIDATYKGQEIEIVNVSEDLTNVKTSIEVDKNDDVTNVRIAGAELQILLANNKGKAIEGVYIDEWTSSADEGHIVRGLTTNTKYILREKTAPYGYVKAKDMVFNVEDIEDTQLQSLGNEQVKGKISVGKTGESLTGFEKDKDGNIKFIYEEKPIKGVVFKLYAAEDILNLDGVTENWFIKDELVTTLTTDEDGSATTDKLPLGKYYVKEISTIDGFVLDTERHDLEIEYEGQDVPLVITPASLLNQKQDVNIKFVKTDVETNEPVEGAIFSLYNKDDIKDYKGKVIVKADTCLSTATSMKDGNVDFNIDIPLGSYYIKEIKAAPGYTTNGGENDIYKFTADYQGQDKDQVIVTDFSKNQKTKNIFTKTDISSGKLIDGAMLSVLKIEKDSDGNLLKDDNGNYITTVIDSWISDKSETYEFNGKTYNGHPIEGLVVGETYIFREVMAPEGYVGYDASSDETKEANMEENSIKEEVMFTVEDTKLIVEHEMKDQPTKGQITVSKTGEVLVDYKEPSFIEKAKDFIQRIFDYVTGAVSDAEFEIYAAEDIKHPDGQSEDIYKKGDLVETLKTGYTGTATSKELPLGKYTVKETVASDGYVLNTQEVELTLSYIDQDTPIVTDNTNYVNERQKIDITLTKKSHFEDEWKYLNSTEEKPETEQDYNLSGAKFGLYTAEDIYAYVINEDNSVTKTDKKLLEKDELIETIISDENGTVHFTSDLPLGKYYVKEIAPPMGYHSSDEIVEIDCTYKGQDIETIVYEADFYNIPVSVAVNKTAIDTEESLVGATLAVIDSDGNIFETWQTDGTTHYVKHLEIGKTYKLVELSPSEGYVTAEPIEFTVNDLDEDGKIISLQSIEDMVDDITKLEISKTDITTGKEVVGAEMQITNEDKEVVAEWISGEEPHYIEKLPIGKYTLTEIQAPTDKGYVKAESVEFEIKDTGEIQKVEMKDDYTKLEISKTDIVTGEEISGATLEIYPVDSKGEILKDKLIDSWKTDGKPHTINYIPVGDYALVEKQAPFENGYVTAETIKFTVKETGEIQKVEMKDNITKVEISKVDITNNQELPGAKLQVIDKDGKVINEWTSSKEPYYIERLPVGDYTLREITAPNGYDKAEDVKFTVKDSGEIQKVVMKDSPTPQPEVKTPTGDFNNSNFTFMFLGFGLIALICGCFFFIKRKRNITK